MLLLRETPPQLFTILWIFRHSGVLRGIMQNKKSVDSISPSITGVVLKIAVKWKAGRKDTRGDGRRSNERPGVNKDPLHP